MKKRNEGKEIIKKPKTASKFAIQFNMSIRQELSHQNGYYVEIPAKEIWEGVEKYCGYTKEEFLENIESKFAPWMTWENNKRPTVPGESTWQLDHKIPRADFKYTRMSDPEFAQCWALSNLEPLESYMNILKSNKNLLRAIQSSFIKGLRTGNVCGGVWNHLDYVPMEARQYLEENWGERIDWENLTNTNLEIDHIIPQAYLAFTSFDDENFRECWSLSNLQVLTKKDNSKKSSVYKNIFYQYNMQ
jgi:5-methylcytosine-specific restriction endonuclease McrA